MITISQEDTVVRVLWNGMFGNGGGYKDIFGSWKNYHRYKAVCGANKVREWTYLMGGKVITKEELEVL